MPVNPPQIGSDINTKVGIGSTIDFKVRYYRGFFGKLLETYAFSDVLGLCLPWDQPEPELHPSWFKSATTRSMKVFCWR